MKKLLLPLLISTLCLTACQTFVQSSNPSNNTSQGEEQNIAQSYQIKEQKIVLNAQSYLYSKIYTPNHIQGKIPFVILAHELNTSHASMEKFAQSLANQGIASIVFDFRGGGTKSQSSGKSTEMTVLSEIDDLTAVLNYAKTLNFVNQNKIIVIGASQGGVVSALTASQHASEIAGLVLLYPAFVLEDDANKDFPDGTAIPDTVDKHGLTLGKAYFDVAKHLNIYGKIGNYKKPVLILQGNKDNIVPLSYAQNAQKTYTNAKLVIVNGAGHSFRNEPYFSQAMSEISQYLKANRLGK